VTAGAGGPPASVRRLVRAVLEAAGEPETAVRGLSSVEVGHTERRAVHREHGFTVYRYAPAERVHRTPVVIAYALVNRPFVLDLQPDRSVVRRLLEAGFPVYLVDWAEPSRLDASLGLADYVTRYLDDAVDAALADAESPDGHLLGYCMGGTMAAMSAALDDERLRTLTTMAAPIAFDGTGGRLEQWATHLDPDALVEVSGNVPAEVLALAFVLLEPVENTVGKLVRLYDHADDPAFVETFVRLERWVRDGVDVPGTVFREFVTDLYRDDALAAGELELAGQGVDLGAVSVPSQHLVGEHDHLVPPASTRPVAALVGGPARIVECPVGHVGLSVSRVAHDDLWPDVVDWLAARSTPLEGTGVSAPPLARRGAEEPPADEASEDLARAAATVESVSRRATAAVSDGGAPEADASGDGRPVETVDGVGATYARRLASEGVETVADLRARDAEEVAEIAGAPPGRVESWLADGA
jgi:polyhydroxyalkanoate synthase